MRNHERIQHDRELATKEHDDVHMWLDSHLESVITMLSRLHGDRSIEVLDKEWESVIRSGSYVRGFIDLLAKCRAEVEYDEDDGKVVHLTTISYGFEVKSHLQSVGEVLRQIRLYEVGLEARFVLVCPSVSNEQARILEEQRIKVVVPRTELETYFKTRRFFDDFYIHRSENANGAGWWWRSITSEEGGSAT